MMFRPRSDGLFGSGQDCPFCFPLGPSPLDILQQILSGNFSALGVPTLGDLMNSAGIMDVGPTVPGPPPLKDISPCLQKAQQAWSNAKSTYLSEIGLGTLGTAIMTGLAFIPGGAEVEGEELIHLILHASPAAAPGPVLIFQGATNLDQAYNDYLNQTANCSPY